MEARAERAALLALAGIEVDPAVFKRLIDEPAHLKVHLRKDAHQQLTRLPGGIPLGVPPHGREQVVEGQTVRMPQQLRLFAQVAPKIRQRLADGGPHGVQRLAVHAAFVKLLGEHVGIAPGFAHGERLALDATQAKRHGRFDLAVAGQLRLIGGLAHGGVRVVGHAAYRGQGLGLAVQIHRMRADEPVAQLGKGVPAIQRHAKHPLFHLRGQHVRRLPGHLPQDEAILPERLAAFDQPVQLLYAAHVAHAAALTELHLHHQRAQLVHQAERPFVFRIRRQRQLRIAEGPAQAVGHVLQAGNHRFQPVRLRAVLRKQSLHALRRRADRVDIAPQGRIVKPLIKYAQIPGAVVHGVCLLSAKTASISPPRCA